MSVRLMTILIFFTVIGFSQQLQIGVMRAYSVSSVQFSYSLGDYEITSDSGLICMMQKDDKITLTRNSNNIKVSKNGTAMGTYNWVYISEKKKDQNFAVQCLLPVSKKIRKYMNNAFVYPESTDKLKIINEVDMPNYLAGVIESEGGGGKHLEYYKVQAILSRTYVLEHLKKHQKDGFQLCDEVHCQAYLNMMRFTPTINDAVKSTAGIVMVGKDGGLADGYFFANCGGQTSEADFVWNVPVAHCKSVRDTFCIHSKQANWEKRIPKSKWENYFIKVFGYPINDSIYGQLLYYFNQPNRAAFFVSPHLGIPLRDIRVEFGLKSTWFSCYLSGNEIVLRGKGFGHGIGLCQEGAMRMAQLGFNYEQILNFYFTGISLTDYYDWLFWRQVEREDIRL